MIEIQFILMLAKFLEIFASFTSKLRKLTSSYTFKKKNFILEKKRSTVDRDLLLKMNSFLSKSRLHGTRKKAYSLSVKSIP